MPWPVCDRRLLGQGETMRLVSWLIHCLVFLFVVAFAAWASLAIWFTVPADDWARFALIAGLCSMGVDTLMEQRTLWLISFIQSTCFLWSSTE